MSIRWITALFTGAVLAASVALVLLLTLNSVLREWRADSVTRVLNTANLLALSSSQALQRGDVIALDQLLREVTNDRRLERVIVADPWGDPISDSSPGETVPPLLRETPALGESYRMAVKGARAQVLVPIARLGTPLGAVFVRFSLQQQQAVQSRMLRRGAAIGAIALIVSAALAVGFASFLSGPLQRLAYSMDRVAGGALGERVPEGKWRELHQMARSFNHMAGVLGQRMHELGSLTRLALVVSRSLTASDVMAAAVRSITGAFPDSRVQIWLSNGQPGYMVLAADSAGTGDIGTRLEASTSPVLAYATHDPRPGDGPEAAGEEMPADPLFAARFSAGAVIAAPLSTRGAGVSGALVLLAPDPGDSLGERMPFLTSAGHQVALALDNARLYEAERNARAEAEEANQAKDQFVALVSHELRNPLNAITSGLHLLRVGCPAEGRTARALEIVQRNAALQTRLVNDLLDLSRLQRGKLQLQRTPVKLEEVVAAACRSYEAEAKEAGLTLTCKCQRDLWVHGDPDRLQQVVMNLLSNAVKFTPVGGRITVGLQCLGLRPEEGAGPAAGAVATRPAPVSEPQDLNHPPSVARITVSDTGIGLDRNMLDRLFEIFRQGEVAGAGKPGLGIGLALVRGIVERHGGRVWAESEGPGKGSRFIVELPLREAPRIARAENTAPRKGEGPIRVLLVEDNADARTMVADGLTLDGYEVHTAASGEDGLEALHDARPDVMLVDIGLPGIDGFEFLRRARQEQGLADVPAFAVTGWGTEEDVRRGHEAGFAGHFVKPVNVAALTEHIREWVRPRD